MNIPTTICIDVMSTDKGEKMCCYDEVKPFDKEIDKATTNENLIMMLVRKLGLATVN